MSATLKGARRASKLHPSRRTRLPSGRRRPVPPSRKTPHDIYNWRYSNRTAFVSGDALVSGVPTPPPDLPKTEPASETDPPLLVVGVGASAGGLEAVTTLLEGLTPGAGLALVVVFHLDPHMKSELPAILARSCRMPVVEAAEGLRLAADHVYICPS